MIDFLLGFLITLGQKILDNFDIILPAILTIIGWHVVYVQGRKLAKRNEVYNLFKAARAAIDALTLDSEKVWKKSPGNLGESDGIKLLSHIGELEQCINLLSKYYDFDVGISSEEIFQLRRAATACPYFLPGGNKLNNLERITLIREYSADMSGKLMDSTYKCINSQYS